jgi:hypothetical protein
MVSDFLVDHVLMYVFDYPHTESRFPASMEKVLSWKAWARKIMQAYVE